jgi:hypothetical protein
MAEAQLTLSWFVANMTELDLEIPGLALDLIEEFGKVVVFETMPLGSYDVENATNTVVPVKVTVKAIVEDYGLIGSGQGYASGLIEQGDKKFTVAAQSFQMKPTSSDRVRCDSEVFNVVNVKAVMSGELPALYEIQARR